MIRRRRCAECNKRFFTADPTLTKCQNCTGGVDKSKQQEAEIKAVRKANSNPKKAPQSVDPRNGLPPDPNDPVPTSSAPKKRTATKKDS